MCQAWRMENSDLFICIDHVGLAVPDLDEAIKFHSEVFGWRELHREVNEEQGVAEAMIGTGEQGEENAKIQLLAPLNENSTIAKFLDRSGPGMQKLVIMADLDHVSAVRSAACACSSPRPSAAPAARINFQTKDARGAAGAVELPKEPAEHRVRTQSRVMADLPRLPSLPMSGHRLVST